MRLSPRQGLTTTTGCCPMTVTTTKVLWLPWREAAAPVARHLKCEPEDAWGQIIRETNAGRVRVRGLTSQDYVWGGVTDWHIVFSSSWALPSEAAKVAMVMIASCLCLYWPAPRAIRHIRRSRRWAGSS